MSEEEVHTKADYEHQAKRRIPKEQAKLGSGLGG